MNCPMCGKRPAAVYKWYQYDNQEQFLERVCVKCADLHNKLLVKGSK
jgi:protein-arginine kinase activator protein McsA